MSIKDLQDFISTVGFPIACCLFLVYQNTKQEKAHQEAMDKMSKVIEKLTEAVNDLKEYIKR